jgi:hypothetical protein
MSREARAKRLARRHNQGQEPKPGDEGINRTPEIASLCAQAEVQEYLERLASLTGQILDPAQLKPPFEPSGRFKWAHPVPQTKLFLSLTEEKPEDTSDGAAVVEVYCDGPNMGSAGGPTLQRLGSIGRLYYQGLLL